METFHVIALPNFADFLMIFGNFCVFLANLEKIMQKTQKIAKNAGNSRKNTKNPPKFWATEAKKKKSAKKINALLGITC